MKATDGFGAVIDVEIRKEDCLRAAGLIINCRGDRMNWLIQGRAQKEEHT